MPSELSAHVRRRVLDAVIAIDHDPKADLSIPAMADRAGMSSKHFQRCFRRLFDETPKSYLRRYRLQRAAHLLKWSALSVTEVGQYIGFETHAGFTKAFVREYGRPPREFRSNTEVTPYLFTRPVGDDGDSSARVIEGRRLAVRIEGLPNWRVATMRHVSTIERTAEAWPRMLDWIRRNHLLNDHSVLLGIHNDEYRDERQSGPATYRYDAAIVVPPDFPGDDEVNLFTIPAGNVAMTEFQGSLRSLDLTWRRFTEQWLPVSGYLFRECYAFDRYPVSLMSATPLQQILRSLSGIQATLCIPVARRVTL